MFIILKTAFAVIRKRKAQYILIGIVMMLISTMLFMGLSMINQSSPFKTMFERANAADSLLILSKEGNDIKETVDWWEDREEVKDTMSYETFMINGAFIVNEKTETEKLFLTEYVKDSELDLLYKDEKTLGKMPMDNEILINYNFTKNRGLEIGDTISFNFEEGVHEFEVSGLVVDPQFSNPFISPSRCFIAPGYFEEHGINNDTTIVAIKYHDVKNVDEYALFETYSEDLENIASPVFIGNDVIQNSYNIIFSLIASILIVVSVLIFIIVIFVIRQTVTNLILQQYKEIGVKKVIGYSNKQIRHSIIMAFCFIGMISSVIGAFIGLPIRNIINAGISNDIQVGLKTTIDGYLLLTVAIVVALIFLFTYIATHKTNKVKPVQAIKYGMPERKVSNNRISIIGTKKVPLSLLLAIKQLFANKRKTISTTFLITLLIYATLVIFNIGSTLNNSDYLASHLLGLNIGDFAVVDSSDGKVDDTMDKIQRIDQVEQIIYINYTMTDSTKASDDRVLTLFGQIIYGNTPKDLMILADGCQSTGVKEITISTNVAKETGKSTGDYITIQKGDEAVNYLISGTYNSVLSGGYSYTLIQNNVPESLNQKNGLFWVYSGKENVMIDEMETKIKNLLSEETTVSRYDPNVKNILSTVSSFPIIIQSLLLIFFVVSGVIILNSTIMDINNSTRVYGIMKATGFGERLITRILVIRTLIMTVVGATLGFAANLLTMNSVMQGVFKVTPFSSIELPVIFGAVGSFIILILFIAIGIVGTLIPSRKIGRISPKQLITE